MRRARYLSATIATLAVGLSCGALAQPARASTTPVVTVTLQDYTNPTHPRYGDFVSVTAEATGPDGEYLTDGDVQIQMARADSSEWTNVGDGTGTYTSYSLGSLRRPVQFRATYSGGSSGDPQQTYEAVTSAPVAIGSVDRGRMIVLSSKKRVCYRVGPAPYRNKAVRVYAKRGESDEWRPKVTFRTNNKSKYCYKVSPKSGAKSDATKPRLRAVKIVYKKTGGMKRSVEIHTY